MKKLISLLKWIKKHYLPIILIFGGIIDQTTDLLVQLLSEINAPAYYGTLLRILVISVGAIKLYISTKASIQSSAKEGDTGGGAVVPDKGFRHGKN